MCAFRNSLKPLVALLIYGALPQQECNAQRTTTQSVEPSHIHNPYFPLAVGNSWSYRCSVEGKFQFTKKITITSLTVKDGLRRFRVETRNVTDAKPLVSYLIIDSSGQVMTSLWPTSDSLEPLIKAAPKLGDRFGKFAVVTIQPSTDKKYRNAQIVSLENFSVDDPRVPEEKHLEWLGKTYGKGIGLVEEADGLGGACILSTYSVKNAK